MGGIKLVLNEAGNNGAFPDSLISYKDELELKHIFFTGSKTYFLILFFNVFFFHQLISLILFKRNFSNAKSTDLFINSILILNKFIIPKLRLENKNYYKKFIQQRIKC